LPTYHTSRSQWKVAWWKRVEDVLCFPCIFDSTHTERGTHTNILFRHRLLAQIQYHQTATYLARRRGYRKKEQNPQLYSGNYKCSQNALMREYM
jgi:hypothetical protein